MKKALIIMTAALPILGAATAAHAANNDKAKKQFCEAAASYNSDVAELNAIGSHATVAELRAAVSRVDDDASKLTKAAHKMKTATAKQFTEAVDQLSRDSRTIPDDATIEQAQAKIKDDTDKAISMGKQVGAEAGCPAPAQQQQQRQQQRTGG